MEKELLQTLDAAGIRFVRILWCDNANIIRCKAVNVGRSNEEVSSTYLSGKSEVTIENIQSFKSSVQAVLVELCHAFS
jgi:glutamine synthetase